MSQAARHVWIIKLPSGPNKAAVVIFHRKYPTVEKRARLSHGKHYTPVPPASQLLPLLLQKIDRSYTGSQFIPVRDRCDLPIQRPVYKIPVENGFLWPLVAIQKDGLLLCCLPLVEEPVIVEEYSPIKQMSVSLGFALLCSLSDFLQVPVQEFSARVSELTCYLNEAAPFGQLRDVSAENTCARLADKPCTLSKGNKLPAWKSSSTKGKPSLHLCVSEYISASQCAQETWQDVSSVYGQVICRPEVEAGVTDVTLNLTHAATPQNQEEAGMRTPLDGLTLHPCVLRADWQDMDDETGPEPRVAPRRIRFCPPTENFTLCHYTVSKLTELPIFGVYHMNPEETSATISVQLKLNYSIKNQFDHCELRIPFYTRSPIASIDSSVSQGSVSISSNKRELLWNIGQKLMSRDQQAQLSATVTFSGSEQAMPAPTAEDAFCRGNNSYAQLNFKIPDFTHSTICVDPKSVQVSPSTKVKLNLSREYMSVDYKIWNSGGQALVVDPKSN